MLGDPEQGEEVAQATFVKLYEKGPQIARQLAADDGRAWLYRVMRNAVLDHVRRKGARNRAHERAARPEGVVLETETVERGEIHRAILAAIDQLEDRQREAILLRYF